MRLPDCGHWVWWLQEVPQWEVLAEQMLERLLEIPFLEAFVVSLPSLKTLVAWWSAQMHVLMITHKYSQCVLKQDSGSIEMQKCKSTYETCFWICIDMPEHARTNARCAIFSSMYCVSADMRWPMRTLTWFTTVIVDNAIAVHSDCTWARDSTRDVARRYVQRVEHPAIWTCSDFSGCSVTRLVQAHPVPDRERTSAFASWTLSRSALQRTNTVLKNCYGNPFWPMINAFAWDHNHSKWPFLDSFNPIKSPIKKL